MKGHRDRGAFSGIRATEDTRVQEEYSVQETGVHNGAFGADKFGLKKLKGVNWNFGAPQLCEHSLRGGEAVLSADGALVRGYR